MARPYWSGRIQISLVSFGVQLSIATEAKSQISFNQISRSTGERVRHQKVLQSAMENSGDGGAAAAVQKDEIVKGYEHRKGEYIIIENSELENLRVPSKHTIDVTQFVDANELSPEYVEKPYFVVPEADSVEAFAVVRKALMKTGKVAICSHSVMPTKRLALSGSRTEASAFERVELDTPRERRQSTNSSSVGSNFSSLPSFPALPSVCSPATRRTYSV